MKELGRLVDLLGQADFLKEQYRAAQELNARMEENELTVSVIGQFKRGKSSVINAMLGEDLLPVGIIPLTTVVTELRFGPAFRAEVCFLDGRTEEICREALADYCSEEKNQGNHRGVRAVRLWTPRQPFGAGVVLVDTPGVGSIHRHNTDSSYAYVEQSDAVLFLLSVDSPVSETERDFLLKTRDYAARFFFAVNKADTVGAEDLDIFLGFCQKVLSESLESAVSLQAVSARTGAGIRALTERIRGELNTSRRGLLAASAGKKAEIITVQARAKLELALRAAALPQETLAGKLEEMEKQRGCLADFSEEVRVLARHRTDLLVERISQKMDQAAEDLGREVEAETAALYGRFQAHPARTFETEMQEALNGFLQEKLVELNAVGLELLETGYDEITALLSGKAAEAGRFVAQLMEEEFGLDYPVEECRFQVSGRSDFTMHIGGRGTLLMDTDTLARLLPRAQANRRFYRRSLRQALEDVDSNKNNMVSNYRYKMQESLRPLCRILTEQVEGLGRELDLLTAHIRAHLADADHQRQAEETRLNALLEQLK